MDDLIEQLKTVKEGSQELDTAIWLLITKELPPDEQIAKMRESLGYEPSEIAKGIFRDSWAHALVNPPRYTRSIDHAMLTVPASANTVGFEKCPKECTAYVQLNYVQSGHWSHEGMGATIPLAICVASMLARKAGHGARIEQ